MSEKPIYDPSAPNVGPRDRTVPEGDNRERLVCPDCGYIRYDNPKMIVGVVATYDDKYLLCKRAIAPRIGFWTLPAGFMEMGETAAVGAAREAREEANARVEIDCLLGHYDLPHISQVHLIYRAALLDPDVSPGEETLEVGLFRWEEIPWDELAFPTVSVALTHHHELLGRVDFAPRTLPPGAARPPAGF